MNFYADRDYIHAKICGLHSLLLGFREYYDIAKKGNFQSVLQGISTDNIKNDHTLIKEQLFNNQIQSVISLAEASILYREMFILFLRYYETMNLKLLCARAFGRDPRPFIWYNIGPFAILNRAMLSGDFDINSIQDYASSMGIMGMPVPENWNSFEELEFFIDRWAMKNSLEFPYTMKFSGRDDSLKIVSVITASYRLFWSRRLRHVYDWDNKSIESYMESNIPFPRKEPGVQARVSRWEERLANNVLFSGDPAADERIIEGAVLRECVKMYYENFHSVNTVCCYLVFLYRQIRNLFSVVDGLRFGLAPDAIMKNIICEE